MFIVCAKNPKRSSRIAGNRSTALQSCGPSAMAVDDKSTEGSGDSPSDYEEEESSSQDVEEDEEEEGEHVHDSQSSPIRPLMKGSETQPLRQPLPTPRPSQVVDYIF